MTITAKILPAFCFFDSAFMVFIFGVKSIAYVFDGLFMFLLSNISCQCQVILDRSPAVNMLFALCVGSKGVSSRCVSETGFLASKNFLQVLIIAWIIWMTSILNKKPDRMDGKV